MKEAKIDFDSFIVGNSLSKREHARALNFSWIPRPVPKQTVFYNFVELDGCTRLGDFCLITFIF